MIERVGSSPKKYQFLLNLNPYRDQLLSAKEIHELMTYCEELAKTYTRPPTNHWKVDRTAQQIKTFAEALNTLCLEALNQNLPICAIGD